MFLVEMLGMKRARAFSVSFLRHTTEGSGGKKIPEQYFSTDRGAATFLRKRHDLTLLCGKMQITGRESVIEL
jgi:hypothetical protein